jgi:hypothetical protein
MHYSEMMPTILSVHSLYWMILENSNHISLNLPLHLEF